MPNALTVLERDGVRTRTRLLTVFASG
ncbi:MAG: hypothetical protein JWQ88_3321, partial [Rhodoferax sp.]|nr:hypothetical protein [Rhodoferax sp.]